MKFNRIFGLLLLLLSILFIPRNSPATRGDITTAIVIVYMLLVPPQKHCNGKCCQTEKNKKEAEENEG